MKTLTKVSLLILFVGLSGCTYKRGYNTGYDKAREYYATFNDPDGKVWMPAYSYGFMRGWESYKLWMARDAKGK